MSRSPVDLANHLDSLGRPASNPSRRHANGRGDDAADITDRVLDQNVSVTRLVAITIAPPKIDVTSAVLITSFRIGTSLVLSPALRVKRGCHHSAVMHITAHRENGGVGTLITRDADLLTRLEGENGRRSEAPTRPDHCLRAGDESREYEPIVARGSSCSLRTTAAAISR
jgi:hypothetical protein